jgi:hypothetical protein
MRSKVTTAGGKTVTAAEMRARSKVAGEVTLGAVRIVRLAYKERAEHIGLHWHSTPQEARRSRTGRSDFASVRSQSAISHASLTASLLPGFID